MGLKQIDPAFTDSIDQGNAAEPGWHNTPTTKLALEIADKTVSKTPVSAIEGYEIMANRMTRLLEVLPGGVVVLSGEGIIQQCNATAVSLLGEPLESEAWSQVIKRAFAPKVDNSQDIALNNGRLVHISTCPLQDEPGQIVLLNDVTETRQLQMKVSHLQRLSAMGEMAARLAHQIRTPLSSALLYVSPLLKESIEPTLRQSFAKKLHGSITHMERLIKDMLSYSRGDTATTAPVSITELCDVIEQQFSAQEDAEDYQLRLVDTTFGAYVYGSQDTLTSALNNLLNNAKNAYEDSGVISVKAYSVWDEHDAEFIEISVTDNGVGISKFEQEKILTPFYTTRSSGTGLGLPVVQSIAKSHRGYLSFTSELGKGSTFSIRLPRYQLAVEPLHENKMKEQSA